MKRLALIVGAVAVLLMGAGVAYASIPAPGGTVNGCYKNGGTNHPLSVVDSTGTCPTGYTALNWNQTGPAGPAGPAGPTGPTGPAGPAGASGISGYQVVTHVEVDPPIADYAHQSVACPSGDVPLGGGATFTWNNTGDNVAPMANSAPTSDGWQAGWIPGIIGGESGDATSTVYAICAVVSS